MESLEMGPVSGYVWVINLQLKPSKDNSFQLESSGIGRKRSISGR